MKTYTVDLHVHTCLSPCAELEMTPLTIIRQAASLGIDIIAIADHNSAKNAGVAMELGRREGVVVLPAMEITSREEVHVLGIFETIEAALSMQEVVYRGLHLSPPRKGDWQVIVDEQDGVIGFEEHLLIEATDMSLQRVVGEIKERGGLAIASHVDRQAYSVMSQMGFVPDDILFDAFEVVDPEKARVGVMLHPPVPFIASSDAHHVVQLGTRWSRLLMERPTFAELAMALAGIGARCVQYAGAALQDEA